MISDKLRRIQDLYDTWQFHYEELKKPLSQGKRASLRRELVFLKEKIIASLKDIQYEMNPKLYKVCFKRDNIITTAIMRADSEEDIRKYMYLYQIVSDVPIVIDSIAEFPTISHKRYNTP